MVKSIQGLHFSTPGMLARRAACGPSAVGKFAAPVPSQQEISVLFHGISVRQRALPVHHTEYDLRDLQHGRRMSSATSTTCCTTPEHGILNLRYTRLKHSTNSSTCVTCPVPSTTSSTSSARRIASIASTTCYMPSSTWSITSGTAPHAACPPAFLAYGARLLAPPAYTL